MLDKILTATDKLKTAKCDFQIFELIYFPFLTLEGQQYMLEKLIRS